MNKSFFTRCRLAAAALFAVFGLSSCFQMESVLSLNADGSGTLQNKILMSAQMKAMVEQSPENPFAEDKLKASGEQMGMELVSVDKVEEAGFSGVTANYKFADVNKVKLSQNAPGDESGNVDPVTFTFTAGSPAKLTVKLPVKEGVKKTPEAGQPDLSDPQVAGMVKGMLAGAKMNIVLKAGSEIVSSNATHVEGNTITLLSMDLEKMVSSPKGLEKMQSMEGGSPFGPSLQGIDGVKAEANETLEVEFK